MLKLVLHPCIAASNRRVELDERDAEYPVRLFQLDDRGPVAPMVTDVSAKRDGAVVENDEWRDREARLVVQQLVAAGIDTEKLHGECRFVRGVKAKQRIQIRHMPDR